jgi:uncharacterized protein (DUF2164 family)
MIQHQQLSTTLAEILGAEWKTEAIAIANHDDYRFDIYTRITVTREDLNPAILINMIKNRFLGTPFYKQTVDEFQALIEARDATIEQCEAEIERLKVFENHYNIEMNLRHGKDTKESR